MKWISVKDRLPDNNEVIIIHSLCDQILIAIFYFEEAYTKPSFIRGTRFKKEYPAEFIPEKKYFEVPDTCIDCCGRNELQYFELDKITHWIPLPEKSTVDRLSTTEK